MRMFAMHRNLRKRKGKVGSMSIRVTPEEIAQKYQSYAKYGNFAGGGLQLGRSDSIVAEYFRMKGIVGVVKRTYK